MDIQLDGSSSRDPDGTISNYTWSGSPDPEDVITPSVSLKQGVFNFSLVVTDNKNMTSPEDSTVITVLGKPLLAPPPKVTDNETITLKGVSVPGGTVVISNTTTGETVETVNDNGYFEKSVKLTAGLNDFEVSVLINGVQSPPAKFAVNYNPVPALFLDDISPPSGQTGTIITVTGSGFTPDRQVMEAYFQGDEYGSKGVVLEATENYLKVMVPFIFLKSEESLQVYVYDEQSISNSLGFQVMPAQDPTPDLKGNEVDYQLDLLVTQLQRVFAKLEHLTKPNIPPEKWALLEENMAGTMNFVETLRDRVDSIPSDEVKANLDAVFGSEAFLLIKQKFELINEILSHSPDGEAVCNVSEVVDILNDIADPFETIDEILDSTRVILYVSLAGNSISCFFGCVPCCAAIPFITELIATVDAIDGIIEAITSVIDLVADVLQAGVPTFPSEWKVAASGPFEGISNHIFYTDTSNELSLYANFTNAGFTELIEHGDLAIDIPDPFGLFSIIKQIAGVDLESFLEDVLGDFVVAFAVDLLDIDEIHVTMLDVGVPSTLETTEPSDFLTIEDAGAVHETHTVNAGLFTGTAEFDIQAECGDYQYPSKTRCENLVDDECLEWGTDYPPYFPVEVIEVPIVEDWNWEPTTYWDEFCTYNVVEDIWIGCWRDRYDLIVEGRGFSARSGLPLLLWNGAPDYCGNPRTDSCTKYGYYWGHKPGWLSIRVRDESAAYPANYRESPPVFIPPSPDLDATLNLRNPSMYPGDTLYISGNYLTPYAADSDLTLSYGNRLFEIQPADTWVKKHTRYDWYAFEIPEFHQDGLAYDGTDFGATLKVGANLPCQSNNCDQNGIRILPYESAGFTSADDQDLLAFGDRYTYLRSAAIGDLNGDGINDLVIGMPEYRNLGYAIGAVYIAFGPVEGIGELYGSRVVDTVDLSTVTPAWDVKITGDSGDIHTGGNSRRLGNSLALGDINGDGVDDLLIGTTDQDESGLHRPNIEINQVDYPGHLPGKAYLFYGREEWQSAYNVGQGNYDVMFYSDDERELGYQVAIGNIYGFGGDLVITAPTDPVDPDSVNQLVARAYIFHPGYVSMPKDVKIPDDLYLFRPYRAVIEGQNVYQTDIIDFQTGEYVQYKGDGLGKSLAMEDINGDGHDDLLIGAPDYGRVPAGAELSLRQGAAYIFYGDSMLRGYLYAGPLSEGNQDVLIEGPRIWSEDERTGFAASTGIVDLNRDGRGEIVVGAPSAKLELEMYHSMIKDPEIQSRVEINETGVGRVYLIDGNSTQLDGLVNVEGIKDVLISGSRSICRFGYSLSSGDLNNDGFNDLLVGAPSGRGGANLPGHVWVLYGSESPLWEDSEGGDLIHLENRRWYSGEIDYTDNPGTALEDGLDYLFTGPQAKAGISRPGFGVFIGAGDLNPFLGDDMLIIDPVADAPEPSDPTLQNRRSYSGMLHIFYQGSAEYWPLAISPEEAVLPFCESEKTFKAYGGLKPYQFSWSGCYQTEPVICSPYQDYPPEGFEVEYENNDQAVLRINGCIPQDIALLRLRVTDARGESATRDISFLKPDISVAPAAVDFGDINIGYTANQPVTLSNTGNADLDITGISTSGSADIYHLDNCPGVLPAASDCTISTVFSPTVTGPASAELGITSNDPDDPSIIIALSGNGLAALEPDLVVIGGNLVFIDVPLGTSQEQDMIIKNSGDADLEITDISLAGASEFETAASDCTGTLAPSGTCSLTVTFTPSSTDPVYGSVAIASNDPDTPVFNGSLSGNGITSSISLTPSSLDFGEVPCGAGGSGSVSIGNTGEATLQVNSISYSGDSVFTVTVPPTPFQIEPEGDDRIISVDFQPGSTGIYQGTVTIESNDPLSPEIQFDISGQGAPRPIDLGEMVNGNLEQEGDEDVFAWVCTGDPVALDVDETEDGVVIDETASAVRAFLFDPDQVQLAEGSGGFASVGTPEGGTCTLMLRSEVSRAVEYRFILNAEEGLTLSPPTQVVNRCYFETGFDIEGGTEPYSFSLGDDPEIVQLIENSSLGISYLGNDFVMIWSGACIPEDINLLTLTVTDSTGAQGRADIIPGDPF